MLRHKIGTVRRKQSDSECSASMVMWATKFSGWDIVFVTPQGRNSVLYYIA